MGFSALVPGALVHEVVQQDLEGLFNIEFRLSSRVSAKGTLVPTRATPDADTDRTSCGSGGIGHLPDHHARASDRRATVWTGPAWRIDDHGLLL